MGLGGEHRLCLLYTSERYWGTPLPIWECGCGHREVIGSIAELREKGIDVPEDIELHKPYIDAVHLTCPVCGKEMTRVPEVIDCWYDSGSMPFAQWHYPFENKETFEKNFPANFISEAVDQTRGWFYTLPVSYTHLRPFANASGAGTPTPPSPGLPGSSIWGPTPGSSPGGSSPRCV